ncbi:hypothetical protein FB45DRAFT_1036493 [Roridomyces roridus]|uniref:Uncharacterized protein n=1 Tax=Roridomyces roridus TaxID=1738132 RepID=A0AAD7B8H3_9AGAR|nr:hypothetical protein FB45DRAFT_1036493 [Roridomyces roridus]
MASYLHIPATLAVAGINFTGAFSRLTSGAHTPEWYAYQIARAPNDAGTMSACIPFVDITLGVLLLPPQTRVVAAAMTNACVENSRVIAIRDQPCWDISDK